MSRTPGRRLLLIVQDGSTALHHASESGRYNVVLGLLVAGAEVDVFDNVSGVMQNLPEC